MTAPLTPEMSPEEVNRRIAELMGEVRETSCWYCPHCELIIPPIKVTFDERHDERDGGCGLAVTAGPIIRNYFGSLDDIAEAEATLTDEEHAEFVRHIANQMPMTASLSRWLVSAPASVRALAFLKAKEGGR